MSATKTVTQTVTEVLERMEQHGPPAPTLVEVRRNAGLSALVGGSASLIALGYLSRVVAGGSVLDWLLLLVLGVIGVANLAALIDARTPLLVADDQGIRIRLGRSWTGLPWGALDRVEVRERHGLRDGRLVPEPRYAHRVLEDLDGSGRRAVWLAAALHGAPLAVPLNLATRVSGAGEDLLATLQGLAGDRTAVAHTFLPVIEDDAPDDEPWTDVPDAVVDPVDDEAPARRRIPDPRPVLAHLISMLADRLPTRGADEESELVASQTPSPLRETAPAKRAEVRREVEVPLEPLEAADPVMEEGPAWIDLPHEEPQPGRPLVIDEFAVEPADDPVIGPEFVRARQRLGLSVDEVADRTRIRPHVIESIEVDDFAACGGDFYARGHLRTLARVLVVDAAPLLASYDERYADAPIDPRRVFEAELAGSGLRATRGGPTWSVLVAAVMALVLAWSVARLAMEGPTAFHQRAVLSGSGGPNHSSRPATPPVPVVLTAAHGGARVIVRNGVGRVVFTGNLAFGQSRTFKVSPPARIQSTDGALRITVDGQDRGKLGRAGRPASGTFVPSH
ncbi:MAG: helix-turn-helix domain-containing protein [Nocardioides sp.]